MPDPTWNSRPRPSGGLRAWWREHVTGPLDAMYAYLDESQQDEDRQDRTPPADGG